LIVAWDLEVMTMHPDLAKQIEDLVRQHIEVLRASAAMAVARAFGAVLVTRASTPYRRAQVVKVRKQGAPRRSPEELVSLGERFHAVLCQRPGETLLVDGIYDKRNVPIGGRET
jgi:hypothetical protein